MISVVLNYNLKKFAIKHSHRVPSQVERYKKSRLVLSQGTIDELEDMQELPSTCNPEFGQHIC